MKSTIVRQTKTTAVNGKSVTTVLYPYEGTEYPALAVRLRAQYTQQGDYYATVVEGYTPQLGDVAEWHPFDNTFSGDCEGWEQFLKDRGVLTGAVVTVINDTISALDAQS